MLIGEYLHKEILLDKADRHEWTVCFWKPKNSSAIVLTSVNSQRDVLGRHSGLNPPVPLVMHTTLTQCSLVGLTMLSRHSVQTS